jgi:GTP cyclohydrolase I
VAYLPKNKIRGTRIVGASKLVRIVDYFCRGIQIQERIGNNVTNFIMETIDAAGAACILAGQHLCMQCRGVKQYDADFVTSSMRGVYRDDLAARMEILELLKL